MVVQAIDLGDLLNFIFGFGIAFFLLLLFICVGFYIYFSLALMNIAKRTKTDNYWLAWIPIANIYLFVKTAKLSGWWTFAILGGLIPGFGEFIFIALFVWWWIRVAQNLKRNVALGVFSVVPIVNIFTVGSLAWGKK